MKKLKDYQKENSVLKIHLGCGGVKWKDFINVDLYPESEDEKDDSRDGCVADCFEDMRNIDVESESIDEIFTSHTIDHFTRWECIEMLEHWYDILKPGGKLVIEVADFWRCIIWLFHPRKKFREVARNQFYGNQWDEIDYETHRYVWSSKELTKILSNIGFNNIRVSHKTETHYPGRDMRIMAFK